MPDKFTFSAGPTLPEIAEDVASELAFITRYVSPLLLELGFPDNLKIVRNPRHEWLEEQLLPNSGVISGGPLAPGVTALTFVSPQGLNFAIGDAIQVDGSEEIMEVIAPAPTATVVNVTRGARGTTAVTIPDGALVMRLNNPATECELAPDARSVNRVRAENYTEIFRNVASVSRSMENSELLASIDDELDHQVDLVMRDLMRDLAKTVINGRVQAVSPEGTASTPRTMDGIIPRIIDGADPAVIDAGGAGLTELLVNLVMQDMFTKGGEPKLLAAPPAQRRRLSALLQGRQRFAADDSTLGAVVERFQSDFGVVDVLAPDIFIPSDTILVLDPAKIRVVKLGDAGDPMEVFPLAREGLCVRREVVGEFGLEIMNAGDGGHGLINNLATS